jgi:hypothetical protein
MTPLGKRHLGGVHHTPRRISMPRTCASSIERVSCIVPTSNPSMSCEHTGMMSCEHTGMMSCEHTGMMSCEHTGMMSCEHTGMIAAAAGCNRHTGQAPQGTAAAVSAAVSAASISCCCCCCCCQTAGPAGRHGRNNPCTASASQHITPWLHIFCRLRSSSGTNSPGRERQQKHGWEEKPRTRLEHQS